jgi:hypothetical protein
MTAEEALGRTDDHPVIEILETLARASGVDGAYAVDRAANGGIHSIALLDEQGQNAEVVLRTDGDLAVVLWADRGLDMSKYARHDRVSLERFKEVIDERILSLSRGLHS